MRTYTVRLAPQVAAACDYFAVDCTCVYRMEWLAAKSLKGLDFDGLSIFSLSFLDCKHVIIANVSLSVLTKQTRSDRNYVGRRWRLPNAIFRSSRRNVELSRKNFSQRTKRFGPLRDVQTK